MTEPLRDIHVNQLTAIAASAVFDAKNDNLSMGEMRGLVVRAVVAAAKPLMREQIVEELAQDRRIPVTSSEREVIRGELMDELIERARMIAFAGDYMGGRTVLQHDRSDATWESVADYLTSERSHVL